MRGRDVLGDQRTGADIGTLSDVDASHDHRTPADERTICDDWRRFLSSWVVPGYGRINLAMDEVSGYPAARSHSAVVTHIASDHSFVAHRHTDAYP